MENKLTLTLDDAKAIATAARVKAQENGWKVVIAIVDDGGHLVYLERLDGVQLGSIAVAQEKARTAIMFRRPTKAFEETVLGGRTVVMNLPGALPIEGGLPLLCEGEMIGAIGVSGVQSFQDGMIAAAGVDQAVHLRRG